MCLYSNVTSNINYGRLNLMKIIWQQCIPIALSNDPLGMTSGYRRSVALP